MATMEDLWARFSLTEEEEGGADVPRQKEEVVHPLAGKFFTKRVLNVDAVARTFKSLWRVSGELRLETRARIYCYLSLMIFWTWSVYLNSNHGPTTKILWRFSEFRVWSPFPFLNMPMSHFGCSSIISC